ncbi:LuxR C-terminal-related transcriptional regulator, partial [Ralstonia pseudosolanacearum]|uniref:LuxR C-terminal-related transcriptional regulator n=1 Tax=Ralstonia pseudosolanacearum TaxID=1310165 RepID=UPI003CF28457
MEADRRAAWMSGLAAAEQCRCLGKQAVERLLGCGLRHLGRLRGLRVGRTALAALPVALAVALALAARMRLAVAVTAALTAARLRRGLAIALALCLSAREREMVSLYVSGMAVSEIASRLGSSIKTVS